MPKRLAWRPKFTLFAMLLTTMQHLHAAEPSLPQVRVESVKRIFHNGEHNAFTDLCRFQGRMYLTFRTCPDGHMVHPTSSILILTSDDGKKWDEVHRFHVDLRDVRDPHFLVFQDKLFVYTGTWYCGTSSPKKWEMNKHLGFAAWTADGRDWRSPIMLEGTFGHYIWRAATFGGKAYLCGRRVRLFADTKTPDRAEPQEEVESALLESDDGLVWKKVGLFQEKYGDETAFLFEEDGSILAVARSGGGRPAQICRAQPPYHQWERKDLARSVGGPLLVKWEGHHLVGGRKTVEKKPSTSLSWLHGDVLSEFAELPSAGDNSYPGFLDLGNGRALVSYYSTHEKDETGQPITAIYLARLAIGE